MSTLPAARAWLREHPLGVDGLLAVVVLLLAMIVPPEAPAPVAVPDLWSGLLIAVGFASLVVRGQYPVGVWVWTVAVGVVGVTHAGGPSPAWFPTLVALYSLVAGTSLWRGLLAALATCVAFAAALVAGAEASWQSPAIYMVLAFTGMAAAIGAAVQSQRAAVAAAHDRAWWAEQSREQEAQRRVAEERLRIARDLHDIVAHHIAVIAVQSGVAQHLLESRPGPAREALGHVRAAGQEVLDEMATLLGLLRTSEDEVSAQPAPGLDQVNELVGSIERAGLRVIRQDAGAPVAVQPLVGFTAYRLVQEALTNAARHGSGTAELTIIHAKAGLTIQVINPVSDGQPSDRGEGHGLVGMRERVAAVGGRIEAGVDGRGRFVVRAELPTSSARGVGVVASGVTA